MQLPKFLRTAKKTVARETKISIKEYRKLFALQDDVRHLQALLSSVQTRKSKLLVDYYKLKAEKDECSLERIEKRLDAWLVRLDVLLWDASIPNYHHRELQKCQEEILVSKNNLLRILARGGELHTLVHAKNPDWEKITEEAKKAWGDGNTTGLQTLFASLRRLQETINYLGKQWWGEEKRTGVLREELQRFLNKKGKEGWIPNEKYRAIEIINILRAAKDKKSVPLLKKALHSENELILRYALGALKELAPCESLRLMKRHLENPERGIIVHSEIVRVFDACNSRKARSYLREALKHPIPEVRNLVSALLYEKTKDKRYHRLYYQQPKKFFRRAKGLFGISRGEFEKTGSRTVVLGGQLAGKVIVRIVPDDAFQSWKKALEAEDFWKSRGFEYVPIEPILRWKGKLRAYYIERGNEQGKWRVFTQVLGPSLVAFEETPQYSKFQRELEKQREAIEDGLTLLKVDHKHIHDNNFCLVFHEGKPRLYVIDFDQAVSSP